MRVISQARRGDVAENRSVATAREKVKEAQTLTGTEALAPSFPLEPSWQSLETVGYNWRHQPLGPISGLCETLSRVQLPFRATSSVSHAASRTTRRLGNVIMF